MTSASTSTTTNEHYQSIEMEMWRLYNMNKIEASERDPTLYHAKAMAARIEELEAEGYSTRISVVYPCCGSQEFWELNNNGELEMDHTEFGSTCSEQVPTYQDRMDELQGQVRRLRRELVAVMPLLPRHIQTSVQRNLQPGDLLPVDGRQP